MAIEVTLPRQGWSTDEAIFVEWLKKDGDEVRPGEPVFSVETDKAAQEIESLDAGILRLGPDAPDKGDTVQVGEVLGYLVAVGEAAPFADAGRAPEREADMAAVHRTKASPLRTDADGPVSAARGGQPVSSRAARRAMQEGVDLRSVQGTGRGGRIREADVVAALPVKTGLAASPAPVAPAVPPAPGRVVPVTTLRLAIAERMHHSKTLTAPVTLTTRLDAGALVRLREQLKLEAAGGTVPAYGDIIMRQVALALAEHPALNARWEEDHIRFPDAINIGFAVDTEAGLLAPVVRDAANISLLKLAETTRDLAERARLRRLTPEELTGGTFTVTNLGMAGIDVFTPIVNWPECAVLGIGRITREPMVDKDTVVVGDRLWLSLTFDHRIVDGAPAARFLDSLRRRVEAVS